MSTVSLNYTPRDCFREAHRLISLRSTRELHIGAGRRLGKTVFAGAIAAIRAITRTSDIAFIAPSLSQALNVGWMNVLDRVRDIPGVQIKKGEALITIPAADGGTSTVRFFAGTDDGSASGVRGYGFDMVVCDEIAQVGADVFFNAILPTMGGREDAQLITIGTFRSVDLMYSLHEDANPGNGVHSLIIPASTANVYDPEELLDTARKMGGWDSPRFQREFEANRYVSDDLSFFDQQAIRGAQARTLPENDRRDLRKSHSVVVGCDPAPSSDRTIIVTRCGGCVLDYATLQAPTVSEIAYKLLAVCRYFEADQLFIDQGAGGQGPAVIDVCRELNLSPVGVNFGGRATDPEAFANVRAELFSRVKDWTERDNCVLPPGEDILREMTIARYEINASNKLQIESKKAIRSRLKMSTDFLDALACTFAGGMPSPRLGSAKHASYWDEKTAPFDVGADGAKYHNHFTAPVRRALRGHTVVEETFDPFEEMN